MSFQSPFNAVTYTINGDDSAPNYFSINSTTGEITLVQSLVEDTLTAYQLRITASDGGSPAKSETTTLVVNVQRNLHAPVFEESDYRLDNVLEIQPLGETLLTVTASDDDTKVNVVLILPQVNMQIIHNLSKLTVLILTYS